MLARLQRSKTIMTLIHLWPFLQPERRYLAYAVAVTLGLTGVEVLTPVLVGIFIDSLLSELSDPIGRPFSGWVEHRLLIALLAAALARGILLARQRALMGQIGQRVAARIRRKLWGHLQHLPLDYLRRRGPGRILLRFVGDARAIQRLVTNGIVQVTQDLLVVVGAVVVMMALNWRLGLAVLLLAPAFAGIFWLMNPRLQGASRATRRRRSRLSAYLNDRLTGIAIVKAYDGHADELTRFTAKNRNLAQRGAKLAVVGGWLQGLAALAVAASGVLVLALASRELAAGRLSGGQLVTFYALVGLLGPILQRVATADRDLQMAQISVERLAMTLAEQPESRQQEGAPALAITAGVVAFEDVSFAFANGTPVLDRACLWARRGEIVALVGANGAGKTTLLELLPRFREPTGGRIVIDGQDISRVTLASLRANIGLVAQETPLIDGTLVENVTYGSGDEVPEARLWQAARLAGLDQFVATLPDGWDTKVSEGRQPLSRGQRQRVALARALIADPLILLLDEATASLDAATEEAVVRTLRVLARHKTVIVATHRPATLRAADRVYQLEGGRLTEVQRAVPSPDRQRDQPAVTVPGGACCGRGGHD